MSILFSDFHEAQRIGDGPALSSCLAPINSVSDPKRLWSFSQLSNYQTVEADIRYHVIQDRNAFKLPKQEANQWVQIFVCLWKCIKELASIESGRGGSWDAAFKAYKDLCVNLNRGYQSCGFPAWSVPCMYTAGKYLRILAIKADTEAAHAATNGNGFAAGMADDIADTSEKNDKLQTAAQTLMNMVSVCRTDDSDLSESRKWGVISMANLLFKTFFKINNLAMTRNLIAMLEAPGTNLPPLEAFPKAQRCTYSYYRGVLDFLKENYAGAEGHLSDALSVCHKNSTRNREQILTYLIPAHMLTSQQLPSRALLSQLPALEQLFLPLCTAIRSGNLSAFDRALSHAEVDLVNRRIYLTLERSRDLCMRNLFRKVFLNAWEDTKDPASGDVTGKSRRTRIKISEFEHGIRAAYKGAIEPTVVDRDEVECFVANMIYKGYMKGYISREHGICVLSKKNDAFPSTGV
ncbi:COP9 signalosome (CSN) subunit [Knufia obscura]|uniref:COP9 signalosome (CSN) subunit n=2 Tax=Knufia TaxID=430999 RepID=A0AAN8EKI9_9EURO|nr:COP9 signalosome (CSN) subunit [Knufia obscura]KAK5952902.1 COP9 signalosome (CSN) subunit [Knufia fluminis]